MPSLARYVPKPLKVPSLARSMLKPLKVPSLERSVPKPLKVHSLARSVPKPWVGEAETGEAGGRQTCHYHRCRPPTSWLWSDVKWSEWVKSDDAFFFGPLFFMKLLCYKRYFNLNCYIGKKVHENFHIGLKIWWSSGSGRKIKIKAGRTVFNFSCKTSGFELVFALLSKKNTHF